MWRVNRWLFLVPTILLVTVGFSRIALGCLWDRDSLAMERLQFPGVHELIVGYFVRHSNAYYEWRVKEQLSKKRGSWTVDDYNDLAVAYDRLGEHQKGIDTIREKLGRWPNKDVYKSEANLGTLLIHSGQLEAGLPHLEKAIEMNADAHFGREVYQVLLVRYVLKRNLEGHRQPLSESAYHSGNFVRFVLDSKEGGSERYVPSDAEIREATKGVAGMMRFGHYDSPILLEAMGDLLVGRDELVDGKMLAARAYLMASYHSTTEAARQGYRTKARSAMELQEKRKLEDIEAELKGEIAQAEALFKQISEDEAEWIRAGEDVDARYAAKYYDVPVMKLDRPDWSPDSWFLAKVRRSLLVASIAGVLILAAFLAVGFVLMRRLRPKNLKTSK